MDRGSMRHTQPRFFIYHAKACLKDSIAESAECHYCFVDHLYFYSLLVPCRRLTSFCVWSGRSETGWVVLARDRLGLRSCRVLNFTHLKTSSEPAANRSTTVHRWKCTEELTMRRSYSHRRLVKVVLYRALPRQTDDS
jgi:hypothetical protein